MGHVRDRCRDLLRGHLAAEENLDYAYPDGMQYQVNL